MMTRACERLANGRLFCPRFRRERIISILLTVEGGSTPFGWRWCYWSFLLKLAKRLPLLDTCRPPRTGDGSVHWKSRQLSVTELMRLRPFQQATPLRATSDQHEDNLETRCHLRLQRCLRSTFASNSSKIHSRSGCRRSSHRFDHTFRQRSRQSRFQRNIIRKRKARCASGYRCRLSGAATRRQVSR